MKLLRRFVIAIVLIAFIATVILVAGSLSSYDWKRQHTDESSTLPDIATKREGLVRITVPNAEFRARAVALDAERTPVLLLHGFPETSAMWLPLLSALADAGHPAVAFDQRGYSPGARPLGVDQYRLDLLVDDVLAVADALGWERFHLIGHDWGAAVGWLTAMTVPDRVRSWTALSIPHPAAFGAALASDPDQQRRSRYFVLFRTPWLPELLFSFNGFSLLESMYAPMSDVQRDEYLRVFGEPGALTAALNWYRAMDVSEAAATVAATVRQPVLFVWGNRDPAVSRAAVAGQGPYVTGPFQAVELQAGHWLMEEAPEQVIPPVLAHLAASDADNRVSHTAQSETGS